MTDFLRYIITFAFQLLLCAKVLAQPAFIKITGENNFPLKNATVAASAAEIYITDSYGLVKLKKFIDRDIEVSCIGYKTQKKALTEWLANGDTLLIQLEKFIVSQEPVQISAIFNKTEKHGTTKRALNRTGMELLTGSIDVIKVANYKYPSRIKSFSFFIPRYSARDAILRLRLFHPDSLGRPGADLLDSSIFITGYKTGAWNIINLEALKIKTPKIGPFFIGLELMPSAIKESSFALEMVKIKDENYSYHRTIMGEWGNHINPMLNYKNYTFYVTLKTL